MNKYKRIPVVRLTMTVVFAAIILAAGAAFGQTGPPPPLKAQIVFGDLVYNLDEDAIAVDIKLQNITSTVPPTPIWTIKDFDSFHAYLFFYGPIGDDARLITVAECVRAWLFGERDNAQTESEDVDQTESSSDEPPRLRIVR